MALGFGGEHNPTPGASPLGIGTWGVGGKRAAVVAGSIAVVVVVGLVSHSSATKLDIKHRFSTGCT